MNESNCPEANFDILYLVSNASVKYDDLHQTEIAILAYLALLLSVYDGHQPFDWGYVFSHHTLGGPDSYGIVSELGTLVGSGTLLETSRSFFGIYSEPEVFRMLGVLSQLKRFHWRERYLDAAVNACFSRSLPMISQAIRQEPGLSSADALDRTTALHFGESQDLFAYFGEFKRVLGDMRDDILVPASVWIDYLIAISRSKETEHD